MFEFENQNLLDLKVDLYL